MTHCVNHPDKETSYVCSKHNVYMCEDCMYCRDPEIYCKFRSSCPIHFLTKRKKNLDDETQPLPETSSDRKNCKTGADRM